MIDTFYEEDPEVQTTAITNRRGKGKSLALAWAGWREKALDIPVSSNMLGMSWWAQYCKEPELLFSQPGCILADEFYVPADRRASMTWDVRDIGILMAQGRKHGEGKYPNHTYVCLPWNLEKLGAVDIRIDAFFDWEWMPNYYRQEDMLVIFRDRIEDGIRYHEDPITVAKPLARGYGNLFNTYEKLLPKKMEERLKQITQPQVKTQTLEAWAR